MHHDELAVGQGLEALLAGVHRHTHPLDLLAGLHLQAVGAVGFGHSPVVELRV
jgi:hypothetical protein